MKRFLLYFLALLPFCASAQIATGFYRVQNVYTSRYLSIVDTKAIFKIGASYKNYVYADLEAIHMLKGFEDSVAYNPATICYIEHKGGSSYNLSGQGLDLYGQTQQYLNATERETGVYRIYASGSGGGVSVTRYLIDNTYRGTVYYPSVGDDSTTGTNRNWNVIPVDENSDTGYFGIKPDVNAGGTYWATMYTGFAYKASNSNITTYRVYDVDEALGCAIIEEVDEVPANTPMLVKCAAATPSGNRMTLLPSVTASVGANSLAGNWYCNDVENDPTAELKHRNVTAYAASSMRMLGTTADGKPAFVKGNDQNLVRSRVDNLLYLPANRCYLKVSSSAPDVLKIMTKEEYITGIHDITAPVTEGPKVYYDLQGRRIQAPSKGLYITNGKKVVIK